MKKTAKDKHPVNTTENLKDNLKPDDTSKTFFNLEDTIDDLKIIRPDLYF